MKIKRNYNHLKKLFLTVCFLAVGLFFSAISPAFAFTTQAPQFPNAANVTACADFAQVDVGNSVEGLGTVHPTLNISTSGNAIAVAENQQPRAYGAPNGDASISNGGVSILGNGFSDIEQQHDYSFTFAPNVTVDYFSVNMLDYGDFNPNLAVENTVALVAYDINGVVVSRDTLSFTSDGDRLPRGGSAGDLWLVGDAVSSVPGEPGNYFFTVTGNAITRVALEFSSNLGIGATDPFFALSVLCFSTEDQPIQPPAGTVCANFAQLPVGTSVEGLGTIHPDLNISTTGNAIVVAEGQTPRAYGAPNGDNSVSNGGVDVLLNGFYDDTQRHEYSFTFAPGVTVEYFSLNMLDYGDFNPVLATNHSVSLVAYDVNRNIIDVSALSYTSPAERLPRSGSAGDLWLTGDAITANPGQPGNYTFFVAGSDIASLELQFSSNEGAGPTDPFFAMSVLCFDPADEPVDPPTNTVCANFAQLPMGTSVEGLGTVHPDLNVSTTGNAIVVAEGQTPRAYGAPNGDNSISNGGVDVLLAGFYDETQRHEYSFSFAPGVTVDYFSLNMLDYGDFNPVLATNHLVSLVAYDVNGNIVDVSSLSYTSSADRLPRSGSAGDLWLTGDAITSSPGQPGNYMFSVAGSEIATLELQFSSNVGVGPTDPFFAMSVLCFEPEQADPELDPPTASLDLVEPKPAPLIGGKYRVHYACSETAPNLVSATINGYDMNDGQQIRLIVDDNELVRYGTGPWANEVLLIQAPEFSFDVTCADDSGNQVSTSVIPEFVMP